MKNIETRWVETVAKDNTKLDLFVATPSGNEKAPGIIIFQEAFGVNNHIQDMAVRFAKEGFIAVAPDLFHRTARKFIGDYNDFPGVMPHYEKVTRETIEADATASYDWMRKNDRLIPNSVSCIGYCMGGKASFIANSILPFKATISYYGGGIAPEFLPLASKQLAPLLLVWGGKDSHITPHQRQQIASALQEAGHDFADIVFSKADHGFSCDQRKSYHAKSTHQAWALSLEFLRENLT